MCEGRGAAAASRSRVTRVFCSLALLAAPLAVASRDAAKEWSVVNLRVSVLRLGTQRRAVLFAGSVSGAPFPPRAFIDLVIIFCETDPSRLRGRLATPKDAS